MANGQDKKYTKKSYWDEQSGVYNEENLDTGEMIAGSNIDMDDVPIVDPDTIKVADITHPSGRRFQFTKEQADSLLAGEYNAKDLERLEVQPKEDDKHDKARRKAAGMLKEHFRDMFWLKSVDERLDIIKVFKSAVSGKGEER
jgi:hypothetical protein